MGASRLFGVGIAGIEMTLAEREILETHPPWALILFRRNIESLEQVAALAAQIQEMPARPRICVDQEGGPVDRFRDLLGPSISLREAAEAGVARRAGELAGEACARLGFAVDLAPVVDRLLPGASERVLRDRCASSDPADVARLAGDFLSGLHARGVGGCVKHFPGLGRAGLDTHRDLPIIPDDPEERRRDLAPFAATMGSARAVMISHAAGPEGMPASLSKTVSTGLLRDALGFGGAAFSDDLEMGALSAFGSLPERCAAAARAGCDLLFVCSRIAEYPECVERVGREIAPARLSEAAGRLDRYAEHLEKIRRAAAIPDRPVADLIADISALREASPGSRGHSPG
ncbi:MAG TPA: glycoside hydrolase family 3 N-terminal domain-containing protein [Thermoanaerobaculia bacterium]|nr:glycoside hydrolase family 3 N-terminal domain-containing protein [Thermoanaerobaculia bacterium]